MAVWNFDMFDFTTDYETISSFKQELKLTHLAVQKNGLQLHSVRGSPLLVAGVTQGISALFQDIYFSGITNSIHRGKTLHSFSPLWEKKIGVSSLAGLVTRSVLTEKDKHYYQPF